MDILIPDSWLRDYLKTKAVPSKIAECLSLCGPAVERIHKHGKDVVYAIEVTTNRVDTASVFGIAREAVTILHTFDIPAKLSLLEAKVKYPNSKLNLAVVPDKNLVKRMTGVLLTDVEIKDSPEFIKERLTKVGQRPINNAIDITNYVMHALGIPLHVFDYDKLKTKKIVIREARKGEKFLTLDGISRTTKGEEVIFDDGRGAIIDLPGVMGAENTKVDSKTKNILLWTESIDPLKIRKASLAHELRTHAANLNEKNVDLESLPSAVEFAVLLFQKHAKAEVASSLFDWYPERIKLPAVKTSLSFIQKLLGVAIKQQEVEHVLAALGFTTKWSKDDLVVTVPSFRAHDISIPEDIAEEVARIYGYFNFPSKLPSGEMPQTSRETKFEFENKIKTLLAGWGGVEVYTQSMVPKGQVLENALKIRNPLGGDGEYMRTSLTPSLVEAAKNNKQEKSAFHLFEIANVYIPQKNRLPTEEMKLGGVFANTDYRHAKGVLEALFNVLGISSDEVTLRKVDNYWVYAYDMKMLFEAYIPYKKFSEISKFPPQVEDLTVYMNTYTKVGEVINAITNASRSVAKVLLWDVYENKYTYRVLYQDATKTLTDSDVRKIRSEILINLKKLSLEVEV